MKCETMYEMIPLLINVSLSSFDEKQVLEHLMECENCRQELAFWIKISSYEKKHTSELTQDKKREIYIKLLGKENTAIDLTKQALKVYFKLIKSII